MNLLEVIPLARLPKGAPHTLTYYTSQIIAPGSFVFISIQKRKAVGLVTKVTPLSEQKSVIRKQEYGLRRIDAIVEKFVFPWKYVQLYFWTGKFFLTSKGLMMKTAFPRYFGKPTKALKKFMESLGVPPNPISHEAPEQRVRFAEGSWKERVSFYIGEIQKVLEPKHGQVLVLFPTWLDAEIFLKFLRERIPDVGDDIILFKSAEGEKRHAEEWSDILFGRARIIIGTRSAVFAPIPFLSLVIVDSEASSYYKSWDSDPRFDAREVAEKISEVHSVSLLLGGNIPREETWQSIHEHIIPSLRLGSEKKTPVRIISTRSKERMDEHAEFRAISPELESAMKNTLERKKKVFLFSGRRGHSANILCRDCGHVVLCKQCESPLTVHVSKDIFSSRFLTCHRCLKRESAPNICSQCGSPHITAYGIGSQKIEEEARRLFPEARILRIDSDASDETDLHSLLADAENSDIIIGTELALRPSFFSRFGLSAVVSLHQLLQQSDFRQEEHVLYIVRQLQEIADDGVLIQALTLDSKIIKDLESLDSDPFFQRDSVLRRALWYPPFAELIQLTVRNPMRLVAEKNSLFVKTLLMEEFTKAGVKRESVAILGPMPAFIPREKNEFVYRIVLKIKDENALIKETLEKTLPPFAFPDVNPKTAL